MIVDVSGCRLDNTTFVTLFSLPSCVFILCLPDAMSLLSILLSGYSLEGQH